MLFLVFLNLAILTGWCHFRTILGRNLYKLLLLKVSMKKGKKNVSYNSNLKCIKLLYSILIVIFFYKIKKKC